MHYRECGFVVNVHDVQVIILVCADDILVISMCEKAIAFVGPHLNIAMYVDDSGEV